MTFMIQITALLLIGLIVAKCLQSNPSRSHAVIICTLGATLLLPVSGWLIAWNGWGVFKAKSQLSETANSKRDVELERTRWAGPSQPESDAVNRASQVDERPLSPPPNLTDRLESSRPSTVQTENLESEATNPSSGSILPIESAPHETTNGVPRGAPIWRTSESRFRYWWIGWLVVSGFATLRLVMGIMLASTIRRQASLRDNPEQKSALQSARERLGISSEVDLLDSANVTCPMIWGWRRPAIIVPRDDHSAGLNWEGLMIHELAHYKRRDHWSSLLVEIAHIVFFWHPVVWIARRYGYRLCELSCDNWALAHVSKPEDYAESILSFVPGKRLPLLTSMSVAGTELRNRIKNILYANRVSSKVGFTWNALVALSTLTVLIMVGLLRERVETSPTLSGVETLEVSDAGFDIAQQDELPGGGRASRSSWTDEQWAAYLPKVPADSRWSVGAGLGGELAKMRRDRALRILEECWDDIAPSVAQQMLKGFQPSFHFARFRSDVYFQVMNLGMESKNPRTRSFATTYLHGTVFRDFDFGGDDYDAWYSSIEGLESIEVVALETARFAKQLADPQQTTDEELLSLLGDEYRFESERNPALQDSLVTAGVKERLTRLIEMNVVSLDDERVQRLIENFDLPYRLNVEALVAQLLAQWREDPETFVNSDETMRLFWKLGDSNEPRIIPVLIGMIDADNSSKTIYGIGYFGLRHLTKVRYTSYHDGAWWRRWWEQNKANFGEEVSSLPIPNLPKTEFGKAYVPHPESLETLEGKVKLFAQLAEQGADISELVDWVTEDHGDMEEAIPIFIGMMDADNSPSTLRAFNLSKLTGLPPNRFRDGNQWRKWWKEHKQEFSLEAQNVSIPELPKTAHGRQHQAYPDQLQTFDGLFQWLSENDPAADPELYSNVVEGLEDAHSELMTQDAAVAQNIPRLIAVIEADNSYQTIYGIGYFALGRLTGVEYNVMNDGAWWRRWWERNRESYPEARDIDIPTLPKTSFGKSYQPLPSKLETFEGLVQWIQDGGPAAMNISADYVGHRMFQVQGDVSVPFFIEWFAAAHAIEDPDLAGILKRDIRHFLRDHIETSIPSDVTPEWFKALWQNRKTLFSAEAQAARIPDLAGAVEKWQTSAIARAKRAQDDEFEGIPSERRLVNDNEKMTYFQIGPRSADEKPEDGWKVLLILPGGDGSADFHGFCRRIHKNAIPKGYVAVQLVAPRWSDDENRTVWPTQRLSAEDGDFTTEEFIQKAVEHLSEKVDIDPAYVFSLGWSSGGPAVYADSVTDTSPVTGFFVAMSVFRPGWMNELDAAKDHPYFILHSPDDWIDFDDHAVAARDTLQEHGAAVMLKQYRGGHGWRDDPYGNIRTGIEWLESKVEELDD